MLSLSLIDISYVEVFGVMTRIAIRCYKVIILSLVPKTACGQLPLIHLQFVVVLNDLMMIRPEMFNM